MAELTITGLFALSMCCASLACVELSGFFPAEFRPRRMRGAAGRSLIPVLAVTSLGLIGAAMWVGVHGLVWTTLIIAGGLAVLMAPMVFEMFPRQFWDSPLGVLVMVLITVLLTTLLLCVDV